jgi:hypothetical protein
MKLRAPLTVVACNIIAASLVATAGYAAVRFTAWGRLTIDLPSSSTAELARKYGDPGVLIQRGAFIHQWVFGPAIALVVGGIAGLLYRRTDWRISTLSLASLIFLLSTPTTVTDTASALLYAVIGWVSMKLAVSIGRLR